MNIKKQLNKIMNYVKELETLSDKQHDELLQYQRVANKFVNQNITPIDARKEFKTLLGVTMFIGGDFSNAIMEKFVGNHWMPIEHEHPEYAKVVDENAQLREALRWHSMSEIPDNLAHTYSLSKNVILDSPGLPYRIAYYSYLSGIWWEFNNSSPIDVDKNSRWCYIPEEIGAE
jgi:hypothetical protein